MPRVIPLFDTPRVLTHGVLHLRRSKPITKYTTTSSGLIEHQLRPLNALLVLFILILISLCVPFSWAPVTSRPSRPDLLFRLGTTLFFVHSNDLWNCCLSYPN